jgi:hypothetical protein
VVVHATPPYARSLEIDPTNAVLRGRVVIHDHERADAGGFSPSASLSGVNDYTIRHHYGLALALMGATPAVFGDSSDSGKGPGSDSSCELRTMSASKMVR